MNKSFFFVFISSLLAFLGLVNSIVSFSFNKNFFSIYDYQMICVSLGFSYSNMALIFFFMVFFVTSMVMLFGQMYMNHYNNKKFFFLTLLFLLSMIFLSCSSSILGFMLGWDGLGLSSLFLIMFYPGKIPMYNSFLTFFFNRLGDCLLIFIFSFYILNYTNFFFFFSSSNILIFFFLLCAFTKSAQFPMSSWLPAAMSAPTPISAMVHSSTLVTAGIFLIFNMISYLYFSNCLILIFLVSSLTFILGGLMGCLEIDLKKIVAFSTMSQISMIIFFVISGFMMISVSHMVYHAFFKTLLFCSCGLIFISFFSNQNSKIFYSNFNLNSSIIFFFFSVFLMSGFYFSSSFYSKDLILEYFCSTFNLIFFFILLMGSFLTIFYSCKIMNIFSLNLPFFVSILMMNKSMFSFFWFFSLLSIFVSFISSMFIFSSHQPIINFMEAKLILIILILGILIKVDFMKSFYYLSMDIFMSKFMMFSMIGKSVFFDTTSMFFSDQLMFKPFLNFNLNSVKSKNFLNSSFFFMALSIFCFFDL